MYHLFPGNREEVVQEMAATMYMRDLKLYSNRTCTGSSFLHRPYCYNSRVIFVIV